MSVGHKHLPAWIGPSEVTEVVHYNAIRLQLSQECRHRHDVFPTALLQPWKHHTVFP